MGQKKKKQQKIGNQSSKIQPINLDVRKYQESLDLYRKHPSLPTLFSLLDQAVTAGVRFQSLESELQHLISIDDDQYYGAYGSRYFRQYDDELKELRPYRQRSADALSTCISLWKLLQSFPSGEVWGYERFLVGEFDCAQLDDKHDVNDLPQAKNSVVIAQQSDKPEITNRTKNALVHAFAISEEASKTFASEADTIGLCMVPWSVWIAEYLPSRPHLAEALADLSTYLESYYVTSADSEYSQIGYNSNINEIDKESAAALARMAHFLLFNRLLATLVYKGCNFKLADFHRERIEYFSNRSLIEDPENQAEYIVAISNLLMVTAKLGVASIAVGVASEREVRRHFLHDVDAESLDLACISTLPASGFAQMIASINADQGMRARGCSVSQALRVLNYGVPARLDPDLFDDMFAEAFSGIDTSVARALQNRVERAAKNWLIPLQHIQVAADLYDKLWSDHAILEKISDALFESDKKDLATCKFSHVELQDCILLEESLDDELHPALFTRKFCNAIDFRDFESEEWACFCQAMIRAGQIRHACTILALNITIAGVSRFYNVDRSTVINVPTIMKLINQLRGYGSFEIVRQAIADLFDVFDEIPAIYKGSLKEFLPSKKATLVSIKTKSEGDLERHKKILIGEGYNVTYLSAQARDCLLKGHFLARNKQLSTFDLSGDAVRNYALAVEGELRSRAPDIDAGLAEELKFLGVDVDWISYRGQSGRRRVFRGLGGICHMVSEFSKLSVSAQEKLAGFRRLATHQDVDGFSISLRELSKIRNLVQHSHNSGSKAEGYLPQVEELVFGKGALLRILCETSAGGGRELTF